MQKKRLTITITSDNFDTVRHVLNTYGDLLAGRERLDTSTTPEFEISMEDVFEIPEADYSSPEPGSVVSFSGDEIPLPKDKK